MPAATAATISRLIADEPHTPTLQEIAGLWLKARSRADVASKRFGEADAKVVAALPSLPDECRAFDQAQALEYRAIERRLGDARDRLFAEARPPAYELHRAACDTIQGRFHLRTLEEAWQAECQVARDLRDQATSTPAQSIADVAAKLGILVGHLRHGDIEEEELAAAVLAIHSDVQRLVQEGGPTK